MRKRSVLEMPARSAPPLTGVFIVICVGRVRIGGCAAIESGRRGRRVHRDRMLENLELGMWAGNDKAARARLAWAFIMFALAIMLGLLWLSCIQCLSLIKAIAHVFF